jgi:hypothetical protein
MHRILNTIAIVTVLGLLAAAGYGIWMLKKASELSRDSDAVLLVAEMVVEHLEANGEEWPRSWDDLRDDYKVCKGRSEQPRTFEELRELVCVDWSATSASMMKAVSENARPTAKVIWLANGGTVHWRGGEPNQIVFNHFADRIAVKPMMHYRSES